MNAVWIILWISSNPVLVNDQISYVELIDHSSIRDTLAEAEEWRDELRRHGVGQDFRIYKAVPYIRKEGE